MVYGLIGASRSGRRGRSRCGASLAVLQHPHSGARRGALALLDLADGIRWARLLQALAASLVAVPTYRWARPLASTGWALAAAGSRLPGPALRLRRLVDDRAADAHRRHRRPARARARAGATVDLALRRLCRVGDGRGRGAAPGSGPAPRLLVAVLLEALAARDRYGCARCCSSAASPSGSAAVGPVVVLVGGELSAEPVLGAYTPIGEGAGVELGGRDPLARVRRRAPRLRVRRSRPPRSPLGVRGSRHGSGAARLRRRDPRLRRAARPPGRPVWAAYVGRVAERYLITALPLLAIGLCAWISRGAPVPSSRRLLVGALLASPPRHVPARAARLAGRRS